MKMKEGENLLLLSSSNLDVGYGLTWTPASAITLFANFKLNQVAQVGETLCMCNGCIKKSRYHTGMCVTKKSTTGKEKTKTGQNKTNTQKMRA